ncbi:MAG: response regulator [Myxococcota bacterium]
MTAKQGTALGVARARFVDGLPRKARELKAAVALLVGTPDAERPREEMRRRLHALYASAQVFRIESLAAALKESIQRLDGVRDEQRALTQEELDELAHLASTLPALGGAKAPERSDRPIAPPPTETPEVSFPPAAPLPRPSRPQSTPPRRPSFTAGPSRGSGRPSTLPGEPLEMIISVLVVDITSEQTRVRDALPKDRYELLSAADPEEALRLARSSAPDVVLADAKIALRTGVDLIARLRSDPLTDFVPVVLLHGEDAPLEPDALREHGADAVLAKPLESAALQRLVDRLAGTGDQGPSDDVVGDATLEEVAERLAKEIHRGIVEAAASGKDVKVSLGDGSELLAAAWATIARVRAELAERSGGQVRFRDGASRGGPAFMSLVDEGIAQAGASEEVTLEGRRIIVADDDPAVVWFFAGLLREEGAIVAEVEDGLKALEAARRHRPDVILSDILMPRMDGLALTRELRRDPALAEVPVILLSWKEDFLQRMRELQAGASGYLRKEAAAAQILHKVREVLRPRARLEAQLRAGGEVRGRIEGVGVLPLLTTIASTRPDARVTVRDAWNLFEIDLREGKVKDVTRTATDGSFTRGSRALPQLLGMTAGRFGVADSDTPVRSSLPQVDEALQDAVQRLGAFVDAVSGARLAKVAKVGFDDDLVETFLRTSPGEARALVERIRGGEKPRDLLVSGEVAPQALETALIDLARRGAVTEVLGESGEDLVGPALEARGARAEGLDWLEAEETTKDIVASVTKPEPKPETDPEAEGGSDARAEAPPGSASETDAETDALPEEDASPPEEAASAPEEAASTAEENDTEPGTLDAPDTSPGRDEAPREEPLGLVADRTQELGLDDLEEAEPDESAAMLRAPTNPPPSSPIEEPAEPNEDDRPEASKDAASEDADAGNEDADAGNEDAANEDAVDAASEEADEDDPEEDPDDIAVESSGMGAIGFVVLLLACFAVGYFVTNVLRDSPPPPEPAENVEDVEDTPEETPEETPEAPVEPPPTEDPEPSRSALSFGQEVPRILDSDVDVGEGQGLLMVQAPSEGEVEVRVRRVGEDRSRSLGNAPVGVALDEGRYEIVLARGDAEVIRFAFVADGRTRVVQP